MTSLKHKGKCVVCTLPTKPKRENGHEQKWKLFLDTVIYFSDLNMVGVCGGLFVGRYLQRCERNPQNTKRERVIAKHQSLTY